MALPGPGRSGHRLHDFRSSLPDEVTVTAVHHPLFGDRLAVLGWKRVEGIVHLIVRLPDGIPGMVELTSTSAAGPIEEVTAGTVLSVDGVRRLQALLQAGDQSRRLRQA